MANALLNTDTIGLRVCLSDIPHGEPMPHILVWNEQIPLHYIPMCIELAIDDPNGWEKECIDKAKATLARNEENKQLLLDNFTGFSFDEEIPFIQYGSSGAGFIYTDEIDDTLEDVFMVEDTSQLTKFGATELDIELYCACSKMQFDEVERLISLGANPNAKICSDKEVWYCLDSIGTEASLLGLDIDGILLQDVTYSLTIDDYNYLINKLISLAAYEKMYSLLKKYKQ